MSIDGTVQASFSMSDRRTVGINLSANLPINFSPQITYSNGSGALQCNQIYQNTIALSSGTYNFDLTGVLTDSYGTSLALVRVKAICIQNNSATNTLTVGNGTNPWITLLTGTGTLILPAGAWFCASTPDATGWAVTASTGDILKFAGTGTDTFSIALGGSTT